MQSTKEISIEYSPDEDAPGTRQPGVHQPDAKQPDARHPDPRKPAGRIIHDARGNAVWKWHGDLSATGTGSGVLKHLDARDLSVEGQEGHSSGSSAPRPKVTDSGGGYNPYDQSPKRGRR